jgi:mono/diheme cytochrome c family protein
MAGVLTTGLLASSAGAQPRPTPSGSALFSTYCATCHGSSAKGDGPLASEMKNRPADLTQIAKRNGGTFPAVQVARTIDGRSPVKGHGGRDMPVWGDVFPKSTADSTPVDEKIQSLVRYLESIQVKP